VSVCSFLPFSLLSKKHITILLHTHISLGKSSSKLLFKIHLLLLLILILYIIVCSALLWHICIIVMYEKSEAMLAFGDVVFLLILLCILEEWGHPRIDTRKNRYKDFGEDWKSPV